jgi:Secretion system C-terminal sorting domain/HYR domain/SprB repeat
MNSNAPATLPVGLNTIVYTTKDEAQNSATCSFTVEISSPITVGETVSSGCFQNCLGEISLQNITGGNAPYTFNWSNGQTGTSAINLCGIVPMTVTALDNNQCSSLISITGVEPSILSINTTVSNDANGLEIGIITTDVSGGLPPYSFLWKKDGVAFSTTEDLAGLGFGNYVLQITDANGCIVTTQNVIVQNIVGINEPIWAKNLKIAPNPTDRWLTILLSENNLSSLQIKIVDVQGKILYQSIETGKNTLDIDMNDFASGVYFLFLVDGKEIVTRKIVKN